MKLIILFILATLVLTFLELLLPGGILGVLAAVSLLIATWFGFESYGFFGGLTVFFGTLVALAALSFFEFKLMAKTSYGRKFFLNTAIEGRSNKAQAENSIIGQTGIALTRLGNDAQGVLEPRRQSPDHLQRASLDSFVVVDKLFGIAK